MVERGKFFPARPQRGDIGDGVCLAHQASWLQIIESATRHFFTEGGQMRIMRGVERGGGDRVIQAEFVHGGMRLPFHAETKFGPHLFDKGIPRLFAIAILTKGTQPFVHDTHHS
jgi:hypothetical protein